MHSGQAPAGNTKCNRVSPMRSAALKIRHMPGACAQVQEFAFGPGLSVRVQERSLAEGLGVRVWAIAHCLARWGCCKT